MKVVTYARVSTKEQEKEGYSISAQIKLNKEYVQKNGHVIVKEFVDVESAKKAGRKNFNEMVEFIGQHKEVGGVVCHKVDRLCRNFKDYITIDDFGIKLLFVTEDFPDTASGKLTFGFKVLLAKNYIDNLREEVKKGMLEKAEQGGYPGRVPVGYVNNTETHSVEIDPEKTNFVRQLFEWYASGNHSLVQIREKCIEAGFRYRNSEKRISKSSIERILKNPFYMGKFTWDKKVYQGKHPPIVSRELFEAVQEAFRNHNRPRQKKRDFAFRGLLTCRKCGCSITAEIKKGRFIYYHCTGQRGKCGNSYVREEVLAEKFGEIVKAIQIDEERLEWIKEALRLSHKEEKEYHNKMIATLNTQYTKIQKWLDQAYIDKLDEKIGEDFWLTKSDEWRREQEEIREKIERHERANVWYFDEGIKILELAQRAYFLYLRQNAFQKRILLDFILSNCLMDGVSLYPIYRKPFDLIAEGIKSEDWSGKRDSNLQHHFNNTAEY